MNIFYALANVHHEKRSGVAACCFGMEVILAKKEKQIKTNAMRILEKNKIEFKIKTYECDEFIDGIHIADKLG